jgi:hypothetical protein
MNIGSSKYLLVSLLAHLFAIKFKMKPLHAQFLPTVSKLCAKGTTPALGTASYEGRNPKILQYDAGTLTLPPVSVPVVERTFYFTLPTTKQNTSRIIQIGQFTQGEVYNFCTNRNSRPT